MRTPAQALWAQRERLSRHFSRWQRLAALVGRPGDLAPSQWLQLAAFALDYRPDLIVELGRGYGNSTALFLEVAWQLGDCRVLSLCNSTYWNEHTRPRLARELEPQWFAAGEILEVDILRTALELDGSQRCLVFWDAHGFEVAEWVLGYLLPRLSVRSHRVLLHDLSDRRYCQAARDYQTVPLWKGGNADLPGMHLGHVFSRVAQAISVVDFTARNQVPLTSADESLHDLNAAEAAELEERFGAWFSRTGHWFWFSLEEQPVEPVFPEYAFPTANSVLPPAGRAQRWLSVAARTAFSTARRLVPRPAPAPSAAAQVISARVAPPAAPPSAAAWQTKPALSDRSPAESSLEATVRAADGE
jgi:hypothetical protein